MIATYYKISKVCVCVVFSLGVVLGEFSPAFAEYGSGRGEDKPQRDFTTKKSDEINLKKKPLERKKVSGRKPTKTRVVSYADDTALHRKNLDLGLKFSRWLDWTEGRGPSPDQTWKDWHEAAVAAGKIDSVVDDLTLFGVSPKAELEQREREKKADAYYYESAIGDLELLRGIKKAIAQENTARPTDDKSDKVPYTAVLETPILSLEQLDREAKQLEKRGRKIKSLQPSDKK